MKLAEIILNLEDENTFKKYLADFYPGIDYYNIELYFKDSIDLNSEIVAFDTEKTNFQLEIEEDNSLYIFMITTEDLLNIYDGFKDQYDNNEQIAERIVQYVIYDS